MIFLRPAPKTVGEVDILQTIAIVVDQGHSSSSFSHLRESLVKLLLNKFAVAFIAKDSECLHLDGLRSSTRSFHQASNALSRVKEGIGEDEVDVTTVS